MSIGIANFYAQHEAPYLHSVTLLFLLALFAGLIILVKTPGNTYAVEPFMLSQVAFYVSLILCLPCTTD